MSIATEDNASLVISVLALIISLAALPTVLQLLFGKPKIAITPHLHQINGGVALRCYISNSPIKSRLLRVFGIVRSDASIGCDFSITENGTNKLIVDLMRPILHGESHSARHVTLSAGLVPHRIIIASHDEAGATVWDEDNDRRVALSPGSYTTKVCVAVSNLGLIENKLEFRIGNVPHETFWK